MENIREKSLTSKLLAVTINMVWRHRQGHKNLYPAKKYSKNHKKILNFWGTLLLQNLSQIWLHLRPKWSTGYLMGRKAKIIVVVDSKIILTNCMDRITTDNIKDKFFKMKKNRFKEEISKWLVVIIFPVKN